MPEFIRESESDLGLSSGLPTYDNICESSNAIRRSYLVLRPTVSIPNWSLSSGDVYSAQFSLTYRNLIRDVIGVNVVGYAPLLRVYSVAECGTTANSFFFDADEPFEYPQFQWGSSYWRTSSPSANEGWWGQFPRLFVNLEGIDPSTIPTVAELGFYVGQEGEVHPVLGRDLMSDSGRMEAFTATVPTGWSWAGGTGFSSAQDTSDFQDGAACLRVSAAAVTSGEGVTAFSFVPIVGKRYRLAGSYLTESVTGGTLDVMARLKGGDGLFIQGDGRSAGSATSGSVLSKTNGWRRFSFDFIAVNADTDVELVVAWASGTATGAVLFDKVTLRPVHRLDTFEARIGEGDIPASETGSPSVFFSGKSVGVGSVAVRNSDGALDLAFGQLVWIGRKIEHWIGGELQGVGEVDRDEWERRFTGIVQSVEFSDEKVVFELEDFRTKFHKTLPPNSFSTTDTDIEPGARGSSKPMLFGSKLAIRAPRMGVNGDFGRYLVADTSDWPEGIQSIDAVYAYADEAAAEQIDTARRISLNLPQIEREPNAITYGIASSVLASSYQRTYTKSAVSGWTDMVATSRLLLHGDGYVEWTSGGVTSSLLMVGLSAAFAEAKNYTDIDYAIYLFGTPAYQVYELGVVKGTAPTRTGTMKWRVQRDGSTITYWYQDGGSWTLHYTSATPYSGPLQLKISIYTTGSSAYAVSLYGFGEVEPNELGGSFDVNENVGPFIVDLSNQFLNFNLGGSELTATIPVGYYTATGLAKEITYAMKSVGTGLPTCSVSGHKFLISVPTGSLNLLIQSGKNKESSIWGLIGFSRGSDRTGSTSYSGESDVYDPTSIDTSHVIRCDARGYIDDASGTYTGVAGALIQRGPDITKALVLRWLMQSQTSLDSASFTAARATAPESLAIWILSPISSVEIFDRIESSNLANIVVGGDGSVYFLVYSYNNETVPLARRIEERDYVEKPVFSRQGEEVFSSVRILYDQRPDTGVWKSENAQNEIEAANYDATIPKEIETYVRIRATAEILAARLLVIAQRPPVRVNVKTSAKLFRAKVGDIVSITRKRGLGAAGTFSNTPFRILSISPDAIAGQVSAGLVEARALPAGQNCISSCQSVCEMSTQNECAVSSQTGCGTACQEACQVNCQVCGQASQCQTTCESACQTGCEISSQSTCSETCQLACQETCQLSVQGGGCLDACESACQVCGQAASCQEACQLSTCQTGCETTCQGCAQNAPCQSTCESACQACDQAANCQVCGQATSGSNCQVCGQAANCETTCETGGCESACQFACQDGCQYQCQSNSETIVIEA